MLINDGWFGDPRVTKFATLLNGDVYSAMGFLVYLWRGCILSGRYSFQPKQLEQLMNVNEKLISLLKQAGLLIPGKNGRLIVIGADEHMKFSE